MDQMKAPSIFQRVDKRLKQNKVLLYCSTVLIGALRTLVGFPFEHPFDSVKTQWQANPGAKNELDIIMQIYRTKGIKGIYAGGLANITRGIIKNAYRFPALIAFPKLYTSILPEKMTKNAKLIRGLTALSIALSEVFLLNPFERLKVMSMTKKSQNLGYRNFMREIKRSWVHELGRGMMPYFFRQAVTWVVFLETDVMLKLKARQMLGLKEHEQIPIRPLLLVSLMVGVITAAVYMPLDILKTHLQMHGSSCGIIGAYKTILQKYGVKGLFTGWRVKAFQHMIVSVVIVIILEKLEYWAK